MEGTLIKKAGFFIILIMLLSGCVGNVSGVVIHNNTNKDTKKVEDVLASDNRLRSAVVVLHEKDLIMGVTVGTFSRFNKEKIEKGLKKKLEDEFPKFNVLVSADSKIIMETNKLTNGKDEKELSKEIKKLKLLSEEET